MISNKSHDFIYALVRHTIYLNVLMIVIKCTWTAITDFLQMLGIWRVGFEVELRMTLLYIITSWFFLVNVLNYKYKFSYFCDTEVCHTGSYWKTEHSLYFNLYSVHIYVPFQKLRSHFTLCNKCYYIGWYLYFLTYVLI